jgi:arylsulfatase A-like enzyme
MLRTERWKYVLHETFRPQLFDLESDPEEFTDLGAYPAYETVRADLHEKLFEWFRNRRLRVTISDEEILRRTGGADRQGILIGYWKPGDP